jgi:tetratricopeptide (TPR) repeat protein
MLVAAAGGGLVTVLARQNVAARKGHPDTLSPAEAALAVATPAAVASPPVPPAATDLLRLAELRRAEQDVDGAIRLYLRAETAEPRLAEIQKKLALCYQQKGDTARAADRYRRYLATEPRDADEVRAILETLR